MYVAGTMCHGARTRGVRVNCTELACVDEKLPRLPRKSSQSAQGSSDNDGSALYPISVVDSDDSRVLVLYVGYDSLMNGGRKET